MATCSKDIKNPMRCTKTKAVLMVERPKVQCDYLVGHTGKHKATIIDKKQEKTVEWS